MVLSHSLLPICTSFWISPTLLLFLAFFFSLFFPLIHRLVSAGSKAEVHNLRNHQTALDCIWMPLLEISIAPWLPWKLNIPITLNLIAFKSVVFFSSLQSQGPQWSLVPQPLPFLSQPHPVSTPPPLHTDVTTSRTSCLNANRRQTQSSRAAVLKCERDARETHCTTGVLLI